MTFMANRVNNLSGLLELQVNPADDVSCDFQCGVFLRNQDSIL